MPSTRPPATSASSSRGPPAPGPPWVRRSRSWPGCWATWPTDTRIGSPFCLDTCHLWAAGYDLRALDDVLERFDRTVGLRYLRFLHLNDSLAPFAAQRDRHADIGQGTIGEDVFAAIVRHPALRGVPKVIETPKGDDALVADRANLARLRSYRG